VAEAICSHRPYRPAKPLAEAVAYLTANSGTLFDPEVVAACCKVLAERPEILTAK